MWDWYTGFIIWKTQNPWTAMRGQMYDYYLDPNACLYGLHKGSEPLHVMYNPVTGMVMAVNNTFEAKRSMMLVVKTYDMTGRGHLLTQVFADIGPTTAKRYFSIKNEIDKIAFDEGTFLSLQLLDEEKKTITENLYWIPDHTGNYSGLQKIKQSDLVVKAKYLQRGKVEVILENGLHNTPAFFNRISLVDAETKTRLLPVFYDNNYITILPGEKKTIIVDYSGLDTKSKAMIVLNGWNTRQHFVQIDTN